MAQLLATIEEAAKELNVPKGSLKTAATDYGFLVRMGRAIRIDRNDYPKLIKACRDQAKAPASTNGKTESMSSGTAGVKGAQVHEISAKLKARSKGIS